jgi:hypothetical protein
MRLLIGALRWRRTPPARKTTPSFSSAETTRCRARTLALGTLSLEPSHVVRQGRVIEARSASSCCERPVRPRAARNIPPVISTIVMFEILCAASARVNVRIFYQPLTPLTGLGLLASPPSRRDPSGMDAKTIRGLCLLAALSLFCAGLAWAMDHAVFSSVFAALSTVAAFGAAAARPRR